MGTNLKDLVIKKQITNEITGKTIIVDAFNILFQFLSTIRTQDGQLLTNKQGKVTSHIIGLFSRTNALISKEIQLAFVFDGKPPLLKKKEIEQREKIKNEAEEKYEQAVISGNQQEMKKYASRTTRLTTEMIEDAKKLLTLMGIPVIQAPSEAEAQAAYMVKQGQAYAVASQDYDSLLFGAPKLIQNLNITGNQIEIIDLNETLRNLKITREQLIALAIMVGTDFSPGVKGIGPKKGLKLVQKYGENFEALFEEVKLENWKDIFNLFQQMPVIDAKLEWRQIQKEKLYEFLVQENDFNKERTEAIINQLTKKQTGLAQWL